jgi:hypothetical protein
LQQKFRQKIVGDDFVVDEELANEKNVHVQVNVINLHGYLENIHHCDFPFINFSKNHTQQFQL